MNVEYNFILYFLYIYINNFEIIESVYLFWLNYGWYIVFIECCKLFVLVFFIFGI